MKVLASLVSLAVVAFLPQVSFANKLAPARQAVKAVEKAAKGVRTGGEVGKGAARAGNLGAAAGAAGSVAAGANAGANMEAGTSCDMGQYLNKNEASMLAAMGKKLGGLGQACAQGLFKSKEIAGAAALAAKAFVMNQGQIAQGKMAGYYKSLENLLPAQTKAAGGAEALAQGLADGCNLAPAGA